MTATIQQTEIINAFKSGNSMAVRAVAGSGKTTTLVMAYQFAPKDSLCVAFNKRNAEDLAAKMPDYVASKTMNALGHAAWMRHVGKKVVVESDKLFKLIKTAPFHKELGTESSNAIIKMVRLAKSFGIPSGWNISKPDHTQWLEIAEEYDMGDVSDFFPYAEWLLQESCKKAFQGLIDFDDQIYMPVIYGSPFKRFTCVAVDEAQDLSPLQHKMVEKSLAPNGQLIIVGDPNQAIYAWRGASSSSFSDLTEKFSLETRALTVSFRCPREVVFEAQKYVPDIEAASEEAGSVTRSEVAITPEKAITVLSRTNAPLIKLAFQALRQQTAIAYTGKDFLSGLKTLNKKYPTLKQLESWKGAEMAKANSASKINRINDKFDALEVLHSAGNVALAIDRLSKTPPSEAMVLSTIHKAKGSEWSNVVYHDYGKEWPGDQENNVKYVGVTRSKNRLLLHEEKTRNR